MPAGTSILLIAVGAILRYAVTASVSGIDLATVGLILIIVGIAGLVLSLLYIVAWAPRRGGEPQARAPGRVLLPCRLALGDGGAGVSRGRLRGLLAAGRGGPLGERGQAARTRRRLCCEPLASIRARSTPWRHRLNTRG